MKDVQRTISFFIGVFLLASASAADTTVKGPLIFSYGPPLPSGVRVAEDTLPLAMETPTIIEIGPNLASFPPEPWRFDAQFIRYWKNKGILLVRRVFLFTRGKANFYQPATVEDLVARWSNALEESGVDGIAIDEVIGHPELDLNIFVATIKEVRSRYHRKLIFCWIGGTRVPAFALQAARDYADYVIPEIYYKASEAKGYPNFEFPRFRTQTEWLERNAPGILKKVLIGIGIHEKMFNDDPRIHYGDFVEAQIRTISSDPFLKSLPGIAFWAPYHSSPETLKKLDQAIKSYYRP